MSSVQLQVHSQGSELTIGEFGEARLVDEIILKRFPSVLDRSTRVADDCAVLPDADSDNATVWTIDPCPTPVISLLGDSDLYHWGWMTAVISLSDLAAMGARPRGMLVAIEAAAEMLVSDFVRYFDGLEDALKTWDCPLLGGNVKDAERFSATSTALGVQAKGKILRRVGAHPGDTVFSFGNSGYFWSAVLARLGYAKAVPKKILDQVNHALLRPLPRVREGLMLAEKGVAHCAVDASDGLSRALTLLGEANKLDVVVSAETFVPDNPIAVIARAANIDPRKLLLSWGNWELVFSAPPEQCEVIRQQAAKLGLPLMEIGTLRKGSGRVVVNEDGNEREFSDFSSLRFAKNSYFTHGLNSALMQLITTPLFTK